MSSNFGHIIKIIVEARKIEHFIFEITTYLVFLGQQKQRYRPGMYEFGADKNYTSKLHAYTGGTKSDKGGNRQMKAEIASNHLPTQH